MSERLGRLGFVCLRFAELTNKIHGALPKASIRYSQILRGRSPVQRNTPKRRRFLLRWEDLLRPLRELLPDDLPHHVVIELVRGTSYVPPIRGAWNGIQSKSSLDMGECHVSDVCPVWRETFWELGGTVFAADDIPDFAIGVVERGRAGWTEGVNPGTED